MRPPCLVAFLYTSLPFNRRISRSIAVKQGSSLRAVGDVPFRLVRALFMHSSYCSYCLSTSRALHSIDGQRRTCVRQQSRRTALGRGSRLIPFTPYPTCHHPVPPRLPTQEHFDLSINSPKSVPSPSVYQRGCRLSGTADLTVSNRRLQRA
ncbi:hypothetical protein BDP81DRAFT_123455 [Colletotrichum phormii]|uniref:Uncharacterized protein n=1 Tax=Colletotrichum phormii TaxID=359342 RepID=A0AAI9ZZ26_9PEZI|nr:uncharacterized protein BDP81DRAFT_123455 [Colletotrichum phormii]KAK1640828.1 hypothetical protein BDP81DRAFT_123455 [Colletotrichum phormii]